MVLTLYSIVRLGASGELRSRLRIPFRARDRGDSGTPIGV